MVQATFEFEGNSGILTLKTHFGVNRDILCHKSDDEIFRLGGTAVNEVAVYEGVILDLNIAKFRAFRNESLFFEGTGWLSSEEWRADNLHCYITESYDLYMEGHEPGWMISKSPIKDANYLFINIDILDGGDNIIKRYRVSPFSGEYRIMNG